MVFTAGNLQYGSQSETLLVRTCVLVMMLLFILMDMRPEQALIMGLKSVGTW